MKDAVKNAKFFFSQQLLYAYILFGKKKKYRKWIQVAVIRTPREDLEGIDDKLD